MNIVSATVPFTTRKLRAKWSAEMATDLKAFQSNLMNPLKWNLDNYKELHYCDAEFWHLRMSNSDKNIMNTFALHTWMNDLKSLLSPGDLVYMIHASDQGMYEKRMSGKMVTLSNINVNEVEPWTFEALGEDGTFFTHVLSIMKIQLDPNKPRVSHWNLDEGTRF